MIKAENSNCLDCGVYHGNFCIFQDELWEKYGVGNSYRQDELLIREDRPLQSGNFLCFFCFEKRLGRLIELKDLYGFPKVWKTPCNEEWIRLIIKRNECG